MNHIRFDVGVEYYDVNYWDDRGDARKLVLLNYKVLNSYDSLDSAVQKMIELSMEADKTTKVDKYRFMEFIEYGENEDFMKGEPFYINFENMCDCHNHRNRMYIGPGAYTLRRVTLQ